MANELWASERERRRRARIKWLTQHPKLWNHADFLTEERRKYIVDELKNEGIVSHKTNWKDVNMIRDMDEARSILRHQELADAQSHEKASREGKEVETQGGHEGR